MSDMAASPTRRVTMMGKLLGGCLFGATVAVIIVAENVGATSITGNAALILAASLGLSIALPRLFFRRAE
jgi:hypothetical protein